MALLLKLGRKRRNPPAFWVELWASKGVTISTVQFEARNEQRLSWTLTSTTIDAIRANWTEDSEVVCQRRRLCELIGGRECPSAPAGGCAG